MILFFSSILLVVIICGWRVLFTRGEWGGGLTVGTELYTRVLIQSFWQKLLGKDIGYNSLSVIEFYVSIMIKLIFG